MLDVYGLLKDEGYALMHAIDGVAIKNTLLQVTSTICPENRSLGAKIALHVGVYYGAAVNKIISDAGSAGGPNSTTAVLSLLDHSATVYNRAAWVAAAAQRPSNVKAICQWLLVGAPAAAAVRHLRRCWCYARWSTTCLMWRRRLR